MVTEVIVGGGGGGGGPVELDPPPQLAKAMQSTRERQPTTARREEVIRTSRENSNFSFWAEVTELGKEERLQRVRSYRYRANFIPQAGVAGKTYLCGVVLRMAILSVSPHSGFYCH